MSAVSSKTAKVIFCAISASIATPQSAEAISMNLVKAAAIRKAEAVLDKVEAEAVLDKVDGVYEGASPQNKKLFELLEKQVKEKQIKAAMDGVSKDIMAAIRAKDAKNAEVEKFIGALKLKF